MTDREYCALANYAKALSRINEVSESDWKFINQFQLLQENGSAKLVFVKQVFTTTTITHIDKLDIHTFNKLHCIANNPSRRLG
jgi:hypothetical protein